MRVLAFVEPCLPSPADRPPSGAGWIHEIKLDGFGMMVRRDGAGVRLLTRKGHDWTGRFCDCPRRTLTQSGVASHRREAVAATIMACRGLTAARSRSAGQTPPLPGALPVVCKALRNPFHP
jgi:ATP-dependent DNA ligase